MSHILSVKKLSFSYGASEVLSDVSFTIDKGDYVTLAGPNGAGKSTLIKVLLGLEKGSSGSVRLFNTDLEAFSDWKRLGYLPQRVSDFNPLFPATVEEVVGLGLLSSKKYPKRLDGADRKKIKETIDFLGLTGFEKRSVSELSGGQQQRVFLARALVSNPELLILDEPSNALDPRIREQFFQLIDKINQERGVTIIIITHDTSHISQYATKLLYLDKKVIFYGYLDDFCHSVDMEQYFGHFAQHLICHQHGGRGDNHKHQKHDTV